MHNVPACRQKRLKPMKTIHQLSLIRIQVITDQGLKI